VQQNRLKNIVDVLVKKGVNPQIRESDGDSKKIYEHKRKRGFIDSCSIKHVNHKCPVFFTEFSNCYVHYPFVHMLTDSRHT
jgi:hypothetical protein